MSAPAPPGPSGPSGPSGPAPWLWFTLGAIALFLGLRGGGAIGPGRFVALIAAVAFIVVGFRETPWPVPDKGPLPDEVDRTEGTQSDDEEEEKP